MDPSWKLWEYHGEDHGDMELRGRWKLWPKRVLKRMPQKFLENTSGSLVRRCSEMASSYFWICCTFQGHQMIDSCFWPLLMLLGKVNSCTCWSPSEKETGTVGQHFINFYPKFQQRAFTFEILPAGIPHIPFPQHWFPNLGKRCQYVHWNPDNLVCHDP